MRNPVFLMGVFLLAGSTGWGCRGNLSMVSAVSSEGGVVSFDGGGTLSGSDGGLSSSTCGDGVVTPGFETCDTAIASPRPGSCPTVEQCGLGAPCHKKFLMDYPGACNATCVELVVTEPSGGDNCCPPSATPETDSDCADGGL